MGSVGYIAHSNRPLRNNNEENESRFLYSPAPESGPLRMARAVVLSAVTAGSIFYIRVLNDFKIVGKRENYDRFLEYVNDPDATRPGRRGLITVANHTSIIDDPPLQAALVGFKPCIRPHLHRWGICKEHLCFPNEVVASFTSLGKVLPVVVGDTVEQKKFAFLARRLYEGDWVHLYPEAFVIQSGRLGRSVFREVRPPSKSREIGLLKWGVGKLAVHVGYEEEGTHKVRPPVIIAYYHIGMEKLVPQKQDPDDNASLYPWWRLSFGNKIRVAFTEEISVDDLIEEYERKHGPRRVLKMMVTTTGESRKREKEDVEGVELMEGWFGSTAEERELYSKVARRVEERLLELEEMFRREYGWGTPAYDNNGR